MGRLYDYNMELNAFNDGWKDSTKVNTNKKELDDEKNNRWKRKEKVDIPVSTLLEKVV